MPYVMPAILKRKKRIGMRPFEEQRSDEGMSVFGKNACKETDGEDGNIEHNGKTGTMKSFYFKGGHFLDGLVFIFAVIDGEPRFHDPS